MLAHLCEELAKEWNIDGDFRSGNGIWTIPFGEELEVILTELSGEFLISTTLMIAPQDNREEFFSILLAGTFLGSETYGAVLSIDEKDRINLSRVVSHVTRLRELQEVLEEFVEAADHWQSVTKTLAEK